MTDHKQAVVMGREAEQAQEVLNRAFDRVRAAFIDKMIKSTPGDAAALIAHHAAVQGIDAARQAVIQEIAGGKLSQAAIDAEAVAKQNQR